MVQPEETERCGSWYFFHDQTMGFLQRDELHFKVSWKMNVKQWNDFLQCTFWECELNMAIVK